MVDVHRESINEENCMTISVRTERPEDVETIAQLTEAAFRDEPHSSHTEAFIINGLRRAGCLTLSLVAEDESGVVGHVAASPVTISSGDSGWHGIGPVSVSPDRQRRGIGSVLMLAALDELRRLGGRGCVVLGDPAYYGRFGFQADSRLVLPGVPQEYFQTLAFGPDVPVCTVRYHDAFDATE